MTAVAAVIDRAVDCPLGINVLRSDASAALSVAAAVGADFVRANVHTGARVTDQGVIEGHAHETLRLRERIDADVAVVADVADDYLGDRMATRINTYRERLAETPVELEVNDRPSVNIVQEQSWVELRLRYLVDPERVQRVRNELHNRIIREFNEYPERVKFPIGRNR